MPIKQTIFAVSTALSLATAFPAVAAQELLNPSFELPGPEGWSLSAGAAGKIEDEAATGAHSVSVNATGKDEAAIWTSNADVLEPATTYRLSFQAKLRRASQGGCVIAGPSFLNRDFNPGSDWTPCEYIFRTPSTLTDKRIRLGVWGVNGTALFDDVSLRRIVPVHTLFPDGVSLGQGEQVRNGGYHYVSDFKAEGSDSSRCLSDFSCRFNTNRWVFPSGTHATYLHDVGSNEQLGGEVELNVNYHLAGTCHIEASSDGATWVEAGKIEGRKLLKLTLPSSLYPARKIFVRFGSPGQKTLSAKDSSAGDFQVNSYAYHARLAGQLADMAGRTFYVRELTSDTALRVEVKSFGDIHSGQKGEGVVLSVTNPGDTVLAVNAKASLSAPGSAQAAETVGGETLVPPGKNVELRLPLNVRSEGVSLIKLAVESHGKSLYSSETMVITPSIDVSDYGCILPGNEQGDLWWCESPRKVSRSRPLPSTASQAASLSAARGEHEAVQLVIRPKMDLKSVTWRVEPTDEKSAELARHARLLEVCYHYVQFPTDSEGSVAWWPDALPEIKTPMNIKAGQNQPLWLTLKIPPEATAGDSSLRVVGTDADGHEFRFPVTVRVYDFSLPRTTTLRSAFGLSLENIKKYHHLSTEEEARSVWDLYMRNFAEHRLCPYEFAPMDKIDLTYKVPADGGEWPRGERIAQDAFSGTYCLLAKDANPAKTVPCPMNAKIPVEQGKSYTLSWAAKTGTPNQRYLIALETLDAKGSWIAGKNIDVVRVGDGTWRKESETLDIAARSPNARFVRLMLYPTLWTDKGELLGSVFFDEISFVEKESGKELVADGGFELPTPEPEVSVDFKKWEAQATKCLTEYGFNSFLLNLQGLGGGNSWAPNSLHAGKFGPYEQGSAIYRTIFKKYATAVQQHLEENKWLDKSYLYWFDEPAPKDYGFVVEGMEEIKRGASKLPRLLTEKPEKELEGSVDIWCPILDAYNESAATARQQAGESIWWYVCTGPKTPYPGLFIDRSAVDLRAWLWMTWQRKVQGVLIWSVNYWNSGAIFAQTKQLQNPWADPMSYVDSYFGASGVEFWGNGDGRLLYPPNRDVLADSSKQLEGPVDSIRWEMLRDGVEDWEYFKLLSTAIAEAEARGAPKDSIERAKGLLKVPEDVVKNETSFSKDPANLLRHRAALAEAIEGLSRQAR